MKRKVEVISDGIRITAVIDSNQKYLTRREVERARNHLADQLLVAAANVTYFKVPLSRVQVR